MRRAGTDGELREDGQDSTLVYILAASHSGSTLTGMLLNTHPQIHTAGELKATNLGDVKTYRCSCQSLIDDCTFWNEVSGQMRSRGLDYDVHSARTSLRTVGSSRVQRLLRPLHRGKVIEAFRDVLLATQPSWRSQYPIWQIRNRELIRSLATVTGGRYIVDSSKIALRLKYLVRIPELHVKIVRLVRDGRAVALTYMDPSNFADAKDPAKRGGGGGMQLDKQLPMKDAAREWRRSNEEGEQVLATIPKSDWIQISYESLCADPTGTLNQVHDFLGVKRLDSVEKFRDVSHHVVGNGMRLDDNNEIRLDERWRERLDRENLAEFENVAGELNRQYGYT